jgi:ABC-type multidrug transport system ATPase subunit
MIFKVKPVKFRLSDDLSPGAYLIKDNWDDYNYKTQYDLYYISRERKIHSIGVVKIGKINMENGRTDIPDEFDNLDSNYFSLGQSRGYYKNLKNLGDEIRESILEGLNDIARDKELFNKIRRESVTIVSLLRDVKSFTVREQYHRLANGGATLTDYNFTYHSPIKTKNVPGIKMDFKVKHNSNPPTNIHTLIGRNGVGKTTLINDMINALINNSNNLESDGYFSNDELEQEIFANLMLVAFSAFDESDLIEDNNDETAGILYSYVGLKKRRQKLRKVVSEVTSKSLNQLSNEFSNSIEVCRRSHRIRRWKESVKMLETDPIFKSLDVSNAINNPENLKDFFKSLSSGHKIVLLTITKLIEKVDEKTLVILDEPEAHLHPPLLSAFIRALSKILIYQNAVGIIATHSPVIIQEVPKSCVWKIRRTDTHVAAERPEIETFGENIGVLTNEVFGLEVTDSGFHSLLKEAIEKEKDYDSVVEYFNNELGLEARALIRSYISLQLLNEDEE